MRCCKHPHFHSFACVLQNLLPAAAQDASVHSDPITRQQDDTFTFGPTAPAAAPAATSPQRRAHRSAPHRSATLSQLNVDQPGSAGSGAHSATRGTSPPYPDLCAGQTVSMGALAAGFLESPSKRGQGLLRRSNTTLSGASAAATAANSAGSALLWGPQGSGQRRPRLRASVFASERSSPGSGGDVERATLERKLVR